MYFKLHVLFFWLLLFTTLTATLRLSSANETISTAPIEVKIGVLANRGEAAAYERWQATINYLNSRFDKHSFYLVPLHLQQIEAKIRDFQLDFILTNSGHYIQLEHQFGISRLATLINKQFNTTTTLFGAVIFTHIDNHDINSIEDLRGKSLVAVNEAGFGGFQLAWSELKKHGLDPYTDLSKIKFTGFPQSLVLTDVLNKKYHVGTFRTDSLEQLSKTSAIDLSKIKIINQQQSDDFPFFHSTALYPEWPFSKLKQTSKKLAHDVALALLQMDKNSNAANAASSTGWTIPLSYKPVNDLMLDLKVGPYKNIIEMNAQNIYAAYSPIIILLVVFIIIISLFAFTFKLLNKKLITANIKLEQEIIESTGLASELKHQATHDPLTNIYNRYAFNNYLEKELLRCKRNNSQLAVILIDLDNFKTINDNYGHHVGDDYLRQFCSRINTVLRDSDINSRYGGDEFAILCLDFNGVEDLSLLTNRILTISDHVYRLEGLDHAITDTGFSLGIAVYPSHGLDAESLLKYSDSEMYKMKKSKVKKT